MDVNVYATHTMRCSNSYSTLSLSLSIKFKLVIFFFIFVAILNDEPYLAHKYTVHKMYEWMKKNSS